ncbi:unnamed protein product [Pleuronectes platessa]|uniref:Uncharacterized protein n=1 Tax=Pleuronectes platessa TaxID=8262 RepID=A0A9N7Z970_PLEPL|nr:unnamed protein product [Pleuronectes platessa]
MKAIGDDEFKAPCQRDSPRAVSPQDVFKGQRRLLSRVLVRLKVSVNVCPPPGVLPLVSSPWCPPPVSSPWCPPPGVLPPVSSPWCPPPGVLPLVSSPWCPPC